jgi:hypothetical protein
LLAAARVLLNTSWRQPGKRVLVRSLRRTYFVSENCYIQAKDALLAAGIFVRPSTIAEQARHKPASTV